MCRAPQWLLSVSVVFLLAGCSTSLRLSQDLRAPYVKDLRAEYLAANPNTPYRTNVSRGEVVKGMDTMGVLAAWGHPEKRVRDGRDDERWLYVDKDDDSGDQVEYTLLFHSGVLNHWDIRREVGGMRPIQANPPEAPQPETDTPKGKPIPPR
jgi:hypothetical protein